MYHTYMYTIMNMTMVNFPCAEYNYKWNHPKNI